MRTPLLSFYTFLQFSFIYYNLHKPTIHPLFFDTSAFLFRNLNLEACLWEFTTFFDMSELLSECGGNIGTDGQVNLKISLLSTHGRRLDAVSMYLLFLTPCFDKFRVHYLEHVAG